VETDRPEQTDRQTDGRMTGKTDRQTETDALTDRQTATDRKRPNVKPCA
jgi:hypothetical protein